MHFNVNDRVRVKINAAGHAYLLLQHTIANARTGRSEPYRPPLETPNGESEWTLWELMNVFGQEMFNGNPLMPFNTNFRFVTKNCEPIKPFMVQGNAQKPEPSLPG